MCAEQFKVQPPEKDFVAGTLSIISERRPLVIESIVALKRTAGKYEKAVQLFEEGAGQDVRSYVFQREWNALPVDNRARYALAVLAIHGGSLTFADIVALTHYEESGVSDALAEVREMFLQVNEIGPETTFQLGALTRAFVIDQSKKLDRYSAVKERIEKYKLNFYPENPLLSRLQDRIESLIAKSYRVPDPEAGRQAYALAMDSSIAPKISEDPRFVSLQAYTCLSQTPPKIDEARRLFGHTFLMKFEPEVEHLKRWFSVERDSGYGVEECLKITGVVARGKRYSDDDKIWFLSRKGSLLYNRGKSEIYFSPEKGITDMEEALRLHLSCYKKNFETASLQTQKSDEYARNTAFFLFNFLIRNGRTDDFFRVVLDLVENSDNRLDPLEDPLIECGQLIKQRRGSRSELNRLRGRIEYLGRTVNNADKWYDRFSGQRVAELYKSVGEIIGKQLGSKEHRNGH